MSSFRLSPNEVARLLKEERTQRRIERLKQVREQAKIQSTKIRAAVDEERERLTKLFVVQVKQSWQEEHLNEIIKNELNLKNNLLELGESHRNALELNVESLNEQKMLKEEENHQVALKRHKTAIDTLNEEKEARTVTENRHLLDRQYALDVEKTRAAMIACLPKPKPKLEPEKAKVEKPRIGPDQPTFKGNILVEKENVNNIDALESAVICERKFESIEEEKKRIIKERRERALQRHKEAIDKEHQKQEQESTLYDLGNLRKEDIAQKKSEVEKLSKQVLINNLQRREKMERDAETKEHQNIYYSSFDDDFMAHHSSSLDVTAESEVFQTIPDNRVTESKSSGETDSLLTINDRQMSSSDLSAEVDKDQRDHSGAELDVDLKLLKDCTGQTKKVLSKTPTQPGDFERLYEKIARQRGQWSKSQESKSMDAMLQTDLNEVYDGTGTRYGTAPTTPGRVEQDESLFAGINSTGTPNSYIPSFSSLPPMDSANLDFSAGTSLVEDSGRESGMFEDSSEIQTEIEKQKKELLNILKMIEEKKKMLETQDSILTDDEIISVFNEEQNINNSAQVFNENQTENGSEIPSSLSNSQSSRTSTKYLKLPNTFENTKECPKIPYTSQTMGHFESLQTTEASGKNTLDQSSFIQPSSYLNSNSSLYLNLPETKQYESRHSLTESSQVKEKESTKTGQKMEDGSSEILQLMDHLNWKRLEELNEDHSSLKQSVGSKSQLSNNASYSLNSTLSVNSNSFSEIDFITADKILGSADISCSESQMSFLSVSKTCSTCENNYSFMSIEFVTPDAESSRITSEDRYSLSTAALNEKASDIFHSRYSSCQEGGTSYENMRESDVVTLCSWENFNDNNNNNNNNADNTTLSDTKSSTDSSSLLLRNWSEILKPYRENPKIEDVIGGKSILDFIKEKRLSTSMTSTTSNMQIGDRGILDEPDLTLVSANTTISSVTSIPFVPESLQDSGKTLASLLSFEKHELSAQEDRLLSSPLATHFSDQVSIRSNNDQCVTLSSISDAPNISCNANNVVKSKQSDLCIPSTSSKSTTAKLRQPKKTTQNDLMYPSIEKNNDSLKETMNSWKASRTMPSQPHGKSKHSTSDVSRKTQFRVNR